MKVDVIYNEDCLEGMKRLSDKSINLIIADPPYNINKAEWDRIPNYIEWLGMRLLEMQRILKDNGSFYLFHNDFLRMVEIQNWINKNTKFIFKQLIVWNQRFEDMEWIDKNGRKRTYKDYSAILTNNSLRNYKKMAEYILFYTFQDENSLDLIMFNDNNFSSIKSYLKEERKKVRKHYSFSSKEFNDYTLRLGCSTTPYKNWFCNTGYWEMASKEQYKLLQKSGFFQRPYEELRQEYKCLRQEYESVRYAFNNQKTHHSVWNYEIAEKNGHITPKPIPLIENTLRHSSNKDDFVLIPFVGSGNDCMACRELDRHYVGFEINPEYCEMAKKRLSEMQLELI